MDVTPSEQPFEELDHTADLRLRVRGCDLRALFVRAAQGVVSLLRCSPAAGAEGVERHIVLQASDVETLLVDWLNELLYWNESRHECYADFDLRLIEPTRLEAVVRGHAPYPPQRNIKAATFHGLAVWRGPSGYEATLTLDT